MSQACQLCAEQRDLLALFGEDRADPVTDQVLDAWHYHGHHGNGPYTPETPGWEKRGPGTAEVIEAKALEVADDEVVCTVCWLAHRPGSCDR